MKHLAPAFAGLLLAMPAMAQNPIDQIRPDAPELAPYGENAIGVRTLTFTHEDQIDVPAATEEGDLPTTDRELTVEIWYPAAAGVEPGGTYTTVLRDGQTPTTLTGRAARDAAPAEGHFPLVILSHGYPGNRFLLSHLGENLASKGYVAASIDHPDSTYSDLGAFTSTLVNRPVDQGFVLDSLAELDDDLGAIIDASRTGVVGYSMGGYGALIFGGAGVTEAVERIERYTPPQNLLRRNVVGTETHDALLDDRVDAIVAIGPWGRNRDFWDADALAEFREPLLLVAGSSDNVSEYGAIRQIFNETTGVDRHLLTFENAGHNAAAPMPAPKESWEPSPSLDFVPFEHYADPVWDTTRMNNILAHFTTAFFDLHLKGETERSRYLDLVDQASDGVWSMGEDGDPTEEHSYWTGFSEGTARGLRLEFQPAQ
ncbi:putative dienelactone hydrolase [Jannaschia seosinensis]|uniref:Putative dienelactone hydrolase n=1 Tax=Jannaschia seosinensis TaxID=313367 RepID=A0A0M7B620_9RHOB|nr:dienelactone hydrolase [Jannaschia seosinensis]CUH11724.1 putative dienelactone hydrolase [Jannaschia seosinensis]